MSDELNVRAALHLSFDPEVLRERYRDARERRIRPDGGAQFLKIDGELDDFMHMVGDRVERDALDSDIDVIVLGGGFAGLQTGARLKKSGVDDIVIIDRASDFGGTWFWNRYPGAACDSEAYCYLPLLEETGYVPSHRIVDAEEIYAHARRIGRHFDLYQSALFQTTVTSAIWNGDLARWILQTDRGDVLRARFLVIAGGEQSTPKLPGIPGIRSFRGHSFHTHRWDYDYTGGDVHGNMEKLADKRVAVIGTGSSAVQIVPPLGESAEHLYVFQRTPATVLPRNNAPTDPEWARNLSSGWQERRARDLLTIVETGGQPSEPVTDPGFSALAAALKAIGERLRAAAAAAGLELNDDEVSELRDMEFMEQVRARYDTIVEDPITAEALKPNYAVVCKRPTWNDDYLPTFNRPNVTLVETNGHGVERITENGVVANGIEYEVDLIIYASGHEVGHSSVFKLTRFPLEGRHGTTLEQHWADGFRTLHGMQVHNMPNYFQLCVIGNGMGANYLYANGWQAAHIAWLIAHCLNEDITSVEPTREAEDEWRKVLDESAGATGAKGVGPASFGGYFRKAQVQCTPSYLNSYGNPDDKKGLMANIHAGGAVAYIEVLRKWRQGGMPGLQIVRNSESVGVSGIEQQKDLQG